MRSMFVPQTDSSVGVLADLVEGWWGGVTAGARAPALKTDFETFFQKRNACHGFCHLRAVPPRFA